jgi:hypothetical protein
VDFFTNVFDTTLIILEVVLISFDQFLQTGCFYDEEESFLRQSFQKQSIFIKISGITKTSAPIIPKTRATNSIPESIYWCLIASIITKAGLLQAPTADTGPAGPIESAF